MADKTISALTAATTPLAGTEVLPIVQSLSTKKVAVNDLTVKNVRSNATTGLLQVAGPTAGTTRVMTTPDANFTVARTDASQTFGGSQTFYEIDLIGATKTYVSYVDATGNLYVVRYATGGGYEAIPFEIAVNSDIKARSGNLVIGTAGKGIDFSANTNAAGMTSELLNDYEEGTWTPVIAGSVTPGTYDLAASISTYTKIGRQVTVSALITTAGSFAGGGTGDFTITGLPFSKSADQRAFAAVAIGGMSYTAGGVVFASFGGSGASSVLYFTLSVSGTGATLLPISLVGGSNFIGFTLSYNA